MDGSKPVKPIPGGVVRLAGLGTELAGAVLGGCLLGYWVDRRLETAPWGLLIGASVGIVGGLYNLVRKAVLESLRVTRKPQGTSLKGGSGPQDEGLEVRSKDEAEE